MKRPSLRALSKRVQHRLQRKAESAVEHLLRQNWPGAAANPRDSHFKNAEREAKLFRQIVESLGESVVAIDGDGKVVAINRAAGKLLAIANQPNQPGQNAALGTDYRTVLRESRLIDAASSALQSIPYSGEFEYSRPGSSPRVLKIDASPLTNLGGATLSIHDITEVRRLERMRQDFVSNVSHELRTPVSIVRAHVETLQASPMNDNPTARQFLDAIARNAERLSTLISDLLDLSRIETGNYQVRRETIDFAQACAAVSDAVVQMTRERNSELVFEFEEGLTLVADASAVEQIMVNLVENALKYGPVDNAIKIRAYRCNNGHHEEQSSPPFHEVRIDVCDRGPGISPEHRTRVFERFYRVDPGRSRAAGGTGLGLSIVKHLSEAMGGSVGVDPREGGGSIFWVCLPDAEAKARRPNPAPKDPLPPGSSAANESSLGSSKPPRP